ncbi:MAG: iron-sulfur cluster-binding domain-containing protein [Gammaproteobacteria bacterium]|nr:iron-sulfur cluster-binding domain-containing protein [Gammaproteobacteria bacterium]
MFSKVYRWLVSSLTNTVSLKAYFQPFIRIINSSWSVDNFSAKIKAIKNETEDTFTIVLKPSFTWGGFKAGQFIQLTVEIEGSLLTRTFSISSAPSFYQQKGLIEVTIQKQPKGRVTPVIQNLLKKNQYIAISRAKGDFVNTENMNTTLFIAGGSGITPIKSLITELVGNSENKIKLMYYSRNNRHLFKEYLSSLESKHSNLTIKFVNTSTESRINRKQIKSFCPDLTSSETFICGPSAMIKETENLLLDEGVNPEKVHFEYFGSAPFEGFDIENLDIENLDVEGLDNKRHGAVTFQQSLIKVDTANIKNMSLLEVAESNGMSPNSGCRMGVCHQCVCKKKQGVIYNTLTKMFSDTGAQDIQLCVSIPVGDVILDL